MDEAVIELAAECSKDPQKWALAAWDWDNGQLKGKPGPRRWQQEINELIRDHLSNPETRFQPLKISVASGHGIGKSAQVGMLTNWALSTCEDCKVMITANTADQLRTKTSPEIGKWTRLSITSSWFDVQTFSIASKDKQHEREWRANLVTWSEHNTEAFAGLHNEGKRILLIFDEASGIADAVWEVADGALTDEQTEIIWIVFGNPSRSTGMFRETFRKYKKRWKQMQIDSRDVEGTNIEYLNQLVADHGVDSNRVKVRVRGLFPDIGHRQFIGMPDIDAALRRHLRPEQYSFAEVILTCDPAWEGDDDLIIGKRQGLHFEILRVIEKNDNDVFIANILAQLENEHDADAVFVDAGYGTGIVSAGRTMGHDWTLVWFSGKANDAGYLNKRAEMWGLMRDWLKAGGSIPETDQALYAELSDIETVPRLDGKIQLESKQDLKARGLPSPNRADALALSFAFPVNKKYKSPIAGTRTVSDVRRGHDPFEMLT